METKITSLLSDKLRSTADKAVSVSALSPHLLRAWRLQGRLYIPD